MDDGLGEFLDVEMQQQAEAGARSPARWLVDLPVYAFGLWILYRSVVGFYQGQLRGHGLFGQRRTSVGSLVVLGAHPHAGLAQAPQRDDCCNAARERMNRQVQATLDEAFAAGAHIPQAREALLRLCSVENRWRQALAEH